MHVLLTGSCTIPKSTDPGAMLAQIRAALRDHDVACGRIRFVISHEDARVIDRVIKVEQALAPYRSATSASASTLSGAIAPAASDGVFDAL